MRATTDRKQHQAIDKIPKIPALNVLLIYSPRAAYTTDKKQNANKRDWLSSQKTQPQQQSDTMPKPEERTLFVNKNHGRLPDTIANVCSPVT